MEFELEKMYRDKVTGFVGVATSYLVSSHEPVLVHLENDVSTRWLTTERLEEVTPEIRP